MSLSAPNPVHDQTASAPAAPVGTHERPTGRRTQPSVLVRLLVVLLATLTGTAASLIVTASPALAAGPRLTAFDNRMLELVNDARNDAGLAKVQAATGLTRLSLYWSGQLADGATGGDLQHNPNAFEQTLSYGASNRTAWAENVAKWSPTSTTADAIFTAYMNSPGHRANILGANYRFIGIASVTASSGASFNTMTFTDKVEAGQAYEMPKGSTDTITVADGTIQVNGWAFDPNSSATSIPVHLYLNGAYKSQLTANTARGDVNSAFGITGNHGFAGTIPAVVGTNTVCVFALSVTGTDNTLTLCKDVTWNPAKPPVGSLDSVTVSGAKIVVAGWTYDPAAPSTSTTVTIKLNGAVVSTANANQPRSDVNSAFGISGNHGFNTSIAPKNGSNQVCVTANTVGNTNSAELGCRTVSWAPPQPAVGNIDGVARSGSAIAVSGWAYDPSDSAASNEVHVYVNGVGTGIVADKSRSDVNAAFGLTGNHGFSSTVPAPSGEANVCLFSISRSGGDNTLLGCRTLAAPPAAVGSLDGVTRTSGGVTVTGWAYDPATSASSSPVHVYINNVGSQVATNVQRNDVNAAFGISGKHGFNAAIPAGAGALNVCVFSISMSGGNSTLLGCRNV